MKKQLLLLLISVFMIPIWAMKTFLTTPVNKDVVTISKVENQSPLLKTKVNSLAILTTNTDILYVKEDATGANNGSSWANAFNELTDALDNAKNNTNIKQIWVAKGTYRPKNIPADFNVGFSNNPAHFSFNLVDGVKIYGGFSGGETSTLQHDLADPANKTILSGDVNNTPAILTDNSKHVIFAKDISNNTRLDGFTITHGNASRDGGVAELYLHSGGYINNNDGGGLIMLYASPIISNCEFINNTAEQSGGAISSVNSSPQIINSKFIANTTTESISFGGAISFSNDAGTPVSLQNCLFSGNQAQDGGAIDNYDCNLKIVNCTIYGNLARANGGALAGNNTASIHNSILWNNKRTSDNTNNQISYTGADIKNSIIEGETNTINGNINSTGLTEALLFIDAPNGNFNLANGSAAINAGNNVPVTIGADLNRNPRVRDNTVDIGAFENQTGNTVVLGTPNTDGVLFVRKNTTGTGSSWDNAIGEFADALIIAKNLNSTTPETVKQIWVSGGTYKPMYSPEDGANFGTNQGRKNSFLLVNDVDIYGSFEGSETYIHERRFPIPSQIISGNNNITFLDGDIGTPMSHNDNTYHVLAAVNFSQETTINGLAIINGNADEPVPSIVSAATINNTAGAGLYDVNCSNLKIFNCVFYGNRAAQGGAVYNNASTIQLKNSAFAGNIAGVGAAVYSEHNATPNVINCTITKNISLMAAGATVYDNSPAPKIYNSIIWGNTVTPGTPGYFSSGTPDLQHNILQGTAANGTNLGDIDPKFLNADILDIRLKAGSPALNSGSNNVYQSVGGNTETDIDLAGKWRLQKTKIDLGAFEGEEYPALLPNSGIVYVDKSATGTMTGDSWTNACPELAVAIKAAKENPAIQQIWVAKGTYQPMYSPEDGTNYGTDQGRINAFSLVNNVAIYGGFAGTETALAERNLANAANETILSGDIGVENDVNDNVCVIVVSAGNNQQTVLDGFTITKAFADASNIDVNGETIDLSSGGGVNTVNSTALFSNLKITNNASNWYGGGIYNKNGAPIFNYCKIENNLTRLRGGAVNENTSAKFNYCIIKQNNAQNAGGGIFNYGNDLASFINCLILDNTSPTGAGVANIAAGTSFVNCLIYGNQIVDPNSVDNGGAAMFNATDAQPKVYNSIIYGNTGAATPAQNGIVNIDPGSITDVRYSLVQGTTADPTKHNLGDVNPMFINASGGDFKLSNGSLAIDAGSDVLYEDADANNNLATDKDFAGINRKEGAAIDLGPFETIAVLPVELISFTAKLENNTAVLRWETSAEKDNDGFEIFRSTEGKNFVSLATVTGSGTSNAKNNYTFTDRKPLNGINYYKLVQKDKDGKTEELGIRPLTFSFNGEEVVFYPNPVKEKASVRFTAGLYKSIILSDMSGRTLQNIQINNTEAEKTIVMDNLTNGAYFLRLQGDGKKAIVKIIKN